MSEVAWLEPWDVESALDNWSAWYGTPYDINDELNAINLRWALAVEYIMHDNVMSEREVKAVKHRYLGLELDKLDFAWAKASLYTALPIVEKELISRKLLTKVK